MFLAAKTKATWIFVKKCKEQKCTRSKNARKLQQWTPINCLEVNDDAAVYEDQWATSLQAETNNVYFDG